jgi:hypothetical protein
MNNILFSPVKQKMQQQQQQIQLQQEVPLLDLQAHCPSYPQALRLDAILHQMQQLPVKSRKNSQYHE